jgi:pimeloyl-ACP methyl ester carboxylesterase
MVPVTGSLNIRAETTTTTTIPAYEITTRGDLVKPQGVNGSGYNNRYQLMDIKNLYYLCPNEVAIIAHGWGLNENQAKERFDRVKMSLEHSGYRNISVIGFSWDSNVTWSHATVVSNDNGPKLADFVSSFMNTCKVHNHKEVKIRLIGHSLGSRVILSSLDSLHRNSTWNNNNFKIASVHLMGAAVDNEEVSKNQQDIINDATNWDTIKTTAYGQAIQEEVVKFYNLYNPKDSILKPNPIYPFYPFQIYPSYEGDWALGQSGYQTFPFDITLSLPTNYIQINVQNEIPPICDADSDGKPDFPLATNQVITRGDNHGGYFGFRNTTDITQLIDDGAINIVVDNWNNLISEPKQNLQLTAICR